MEGGLQRWRELSAICPVRAFSGAFKSPNMAS
jgi:hypothetical protein